MAGGAFVDLNVSDSDELRIDKINQNMRALSRRGGGTSTLVVQQPLLSQGPVYAGGPDMGGGYMKEDSAYQEFPTFPAMQEALRAAVREAVLAAHPVGSYYLTEADVDPGELIGGSWEKLEGYFLRAGSGTGTGGSDEKTLSVDNMPSHNHGMGHTHTVKHSHWMRHTHSLSSHTHSLSSHTHGLSNHTHNLSSHYHGLVGGENFLPYYWGTKGWYSLSNDHNSNYRAFASTSYGGNLKNTGGPSNNWSGGPSNNTSGGPSNNTSGGPSNNTSGNSPDRTNDETPTTSGASSNDTGSTGGGQAFDVKPRYKDVHVWRRVA